MTLVDKHRCRFNISHEQKSWLEKNPVRYPTLMPNGNGPKAATIEMVAAEAGVSKTTVSFVLNNNPTISLATRERVLQAIAKLGYHPNVHARNLSSQKSRTICVLVPEIGRIFEDPYFARAIGGVYDEIEAAEYNLILKKTSFQFAKEKEYLNLFRRVEIGGMIYIGSTLDDSYLKDFVDTTFPFVFVNSYLPDVSLPYVIADNVKMGYLATKHLIDLGHRRIAHIRGSENTVTAMERFEGYKKALAEAGIEFDKTLVADGHYSREESASAARKVLELPVRPTAIYACNDIMAMGVQEAMKAAGLRRVTDCALVGSDNIEMSRFTHPPLTTVNMPIYEISRAAVRLLFDLMEGKLPNGNAKQVMDTFLVVRESCGAKHQPRRRADGWTRSTDGRTADKGKKETKGRALIGKQPN